MVRQAVDPFDEAELEIQDIQKKYSDTEDQIAELRKKIQGYQSKALLAKEKGNPETLSNTLIRLARVNSALGSRAAYAKKVARDSERAYRRLRGRTQLKFIDEQKMAIGKAEQAAYMDENVDRAFRIYSDVQFLADDAEDLSYRTDTFMKMAQSGLSLIKNDIQGRP